MGESKLIEPITGPNVPCTGVLEFGLCAGQTSVNKYEATYPLRFITPLSDVIEDPLTRGKWVYMVGYGGGLLAGDEIGVRCLVRSSCLALVTTQSSTKVYKQHGDHKVTTQRLDATVEPEALLIFCPEAVTCYKDAEYEQFQEFQIAKSSSLVLIDSVTSGRISRGESWSFKSYRSINRVFIDGKLAFTDSQRIDPTSLMGPAHAVSTIFLYGPQVLPVLETLREEDNSARTQRTLKNECYRVHPLTRKRHFFVVSWSEQDSGAIVLRVTSSNTEILRDYIRELLQPFTSTFGGPVVENF